MTRPCAGVPFFFSFISSFFFFFFLSFLYRFIYVVPGKSERMKFYKTPPENKKQSPLDSYSQYEIRNQRLLLLPFDPFQNTLTCSLRQSPRIISLCVPWLHLPRFFVYPSTTKKTEVSQKMESQEIISQISLTNYYEVESEITRSAAHSTSCPYCGSRQGQWRGYRTRQTDSLTSHRRVCNTCKKWWAVTC